MTANRRVFWMLASAFMALLCSAIEPAASAVFVLITSFWVTRNALLLILQRRPE
jgi:hypothetical protein